MGKLLCSQIGITNIVNGYISQSSLWLQCTCLQTSTVILHRNWKINLKNHVEIQRPMMVKLNLNNKETLLKLELGLEVCRFPVSWGAVILIPKVAVQVCTPASNVPFARHPQQHELSYVSLTLNSQECQKTGVRWNL